MTEAPTATDHLAAVEPTELIQGLAAVAGLLSRVDVDGLLGRHDARDNRIHVGYSEAAERLNIPEKWLREHISALPHRKMGKFTQFTEEDLRAISDMHSVKPDPQSEKSDQPIFQMQPSKRSRRRH